MEKTLVACAALVAVSCARAEPPSAPAPPARMLRHGADRTAIPYDEPHAEAKRALFERINRDRVRHGVPPVAYEPRAALVGDVFCLGTALSGARGHWNVDGRAPYVRWGLAGGVDYHSQNAGSYSVSNGILSRPVSDLLLDRHEAMMAEQPPDDGHRRLILDPLFTHVGIGLARVAGEFRMSQEFTRVAFDWVDLPDRPLPAGTAAAFAGRPLPGWTVGAVEIRFEPPPRPLTLREIRERRSYRYPEVIRVLHPRLPGLYVLPDGGRGDFAVRKDGTFGIVFPLDAGPGSYVVVCHLRRPGDRGEPMTPATAALITAR